MGTVRPEIGRTYRVLFSDCCVAGRFESWLADVLKDANGWVHEIQFGNGVCLTTWDAVTMIDVDTDTAVDIDGTWTR